MESNFSINLRMENQMVGEKIIIQLVVIMKDLLLMEFPMVLEDSSWKMEIFIKEKLNLAGPMETVIFLLIMDNTEALLRTTFDMDAVKKELMIYFFKEFFNMEIKKKVF